MGIFKKDKNNEEMPELTEKDLSEIAAESFNDVYGVLVKHINNDLMYKAAQKKESYKLSKAYIERLYPELDHSVLVELSTLMTLNEGLKVKFVPSKTAFIELEADFKPDSPDETGRREAFKIVKFAKNGEKVFNKYYTKEEALQVKADRMGVDVQKSKKKKLSFFERLAENEYSPLNDGSGRER